MTDSVLPGAAITILLATCRIGALVYSAPVIGGRHLPRRIQLAFVVCVAMLVAPALARDQSVGLSHAAQLIPVAAGELAMGAALGFALTVIVAALKHAGAMIGAMSGWSLGSHLDPARGTAVDPVSRLFGWVSVVAFILIGGPGFAIGGVLNSFQVFPVGEVIDGRALSMFLAQYLQISFMLAVQLALPMLIALAAGHFAIGIVARTSPALAGFPTNALLSIGLASVLLVVFFDETAHVFAASMDSLFESITNDWLPVGDGGVSQEQAQAST